MRVAELMTPRVVTIDRHASVQEAVVTLADGHVSALPVTDASGQMLGVLSETDIMTAEAEVDDKIAREALFAATPVGDLMTARPLTVTPDTEVKEAAQQMLYANVHRLFVTSGDQLVGVISSSDIVRAVARGLL